VPPSEASQAQAAAELAESEFIQAFSSPAHLAALAASGRLRCAAFLQQLRQLLAKWSSPERLSDLRFLMALELLRQVTSSASFREACSVPAFIAALKEEQFAHWAGGSELQ
jgi:hypothetical protein